MKQYTTQEQTAKLIELGVAKPKSYHDIEWDGTEAYDYQLDYSIGELIEMMPEEIYIDETTYSKVINKTEVFYYSWIFETYALLICDVQKELIDNLYDMIVQLKERGVV